MPDVMSAAAPRGELRLAPTPPGTSPRTSTREQQRVRGSVVLAQTSSEMLLPELKTSDTAMERHKPLPTSLQSDFVPDEIMLALTQPPPAPETLGPNARNRNLSTSLAVTRKPAANVWSYPKRREKFKHLTQNTPCLCGAGKDISFLYDVPKKEEKVAKPDPADPSNIRAPEDEERKPVLSLPDTLIPEEYHVVKNKGVMGLEYYEDEYANHVQDHEKHLVIFPSMKPTSRFEVQQLKQTMSTMLCELGIQEEEKELRGPTQMHNLLELIKKEQNIYNVIFHELIRQTSVECVERGELLAELRERYSNLLNRIPRQVKSLHEEVLAQRALDRRLTEELMRFKSTISVLTSELSEVKEHDRQVTHEASQAQDDLKSALAEAQKNAGLLAEYHDLYELQRKRLEKQVSLLAEEKEIWSTAAYSLALKVTQEHSLNTAKRLHVSEKSWAKLANHFTILLSDNDTVTLTKLQGFVDQWRDLMDDFNIAMIQRENEMTKTLNAVRAGIQNWNKEFQKNILDRNGHIAKVPDREKMILIYTNIKSFEEMLSSQGEKFGGDTLLTGQEALLQIRKMMDGWTDCALKVFNRHRGEDGSNYPDHEEMIKMNEILSDIPDEAHEESGAEDHTEHMFQVNEEVEEMLQQFHVRLTGENGVATGLIHVANNIENWSQKFNAVMHGSNPLPDAEWVRFYQQLDEWVASIDQTVAIVGSTQKEDDLNEQKPHRKVHLSDVMRLTQKWLSSSTNGIDSEDAKLVEKVGTLHTEMVKWMVQLLLRLAPDKKEHSAEARQAVLLGSASVGELQSSAKSLFSRLDMFSKYVTLCCNGIVLNLMQEKRDRHEEDADHEYKDLLKLKAECDEWIRTAKMLLAELTGEPFPETVSSADVQAALPKVAEEGEDGAKTGEEGQNTDPNTEDGAEIEGDAPEGDKLDFLSEEREPLEKTVSMPLAPSVESEIPVPDRPNTAPITPRDSPRMEQIEIIGKDANTHTAILDHALGTPPPPEDLTRPVSRKTKDRPETPNTKKAYEALAALEGLQLQVVSSEERAQAAEDRAADAEAALKQAEERIAVLERRMPSPEPEDTASSKPKSASSQASAPKDTEQAPAPDKEQKEAADKK